MYAKRRAAIAALGLSLSLAGGVAQGALLSLQDDDIDFILNPNLTVKTSGALAVGDLFVSVLEVPTFTINGVNAIPAGQQMTGVAAIQLQAIIGAGVGAQYVFGVVPGGLNSILALGTNPDPVVNEGGAGQGAAIAWYFNGTSGAGGDINLELDRSILPATNCTSLANCIDQASLGTLVQVDGFATDNDFWAASQITAGGGDIGTVLGTSNSTVVAAFNLGLSTFFNATGPVGFISVLTGLPCAGPAVPGCVQFAGSGTISGGQGLVNSAIAHSDFDAQKFTVPEPGILALLGAALLGLGFTRRKSQA